MKTIYFIRHGESHANRSFFLQQTGDTLLTARGVMQARESGEYLKKVDAKALISSTFARAKATAEEIGKETGLHVEFSELLIERRRPSVQLLRRKLDPRWLWAQAKLALYSGRTGYKLSDEETPSDILQRANEALAMLATRPEERIIVVTHGRFMRALYAHILEGESVAAHVYLHLARMMRMRNTHLMIATLDTENAWNVIAWDVLATEISLFMA